MTDSPASPVPTSVVIATHTSQRCQSLTQAVASSLEQRPKPYEVLVVVDNNPDMYEWVCEELPDVVAVNHRGTTGASATRNAGARIAGATVLAFLDDDAIARPNWLQCLTAPLARPDVAGVGGYVEPIWVGQKPQWMPDEFLWVVGATYRGMPRTPGPIRNAWSENMAVKRADFWKIGGFREGYGKTGLVTRGAEDTDFCIRLTSALEGRAWWYEPSARVGHTVPSSRSTLKFFARRCYIEGETKADMAALLGPEKAMHDEWQHATKTLPRGVVTEMQQAFRDRQLAAAQRASAIGLGLSTAALGYTVSWLRRRIRRTDAC